MTQEMIRADIFIVPNRAAQWEGSLAQKSGFDLATWHARQQIMYVNKVTRPSDFASEKFVEVWFATPGNKQSNWFDHGIDGYDCLKNWELVTNRLPASVFEGHKEGDVVTLELPVESEDYQRKFIKVALTLSQRKYRYRDFGDFEEVVKKVSA